MHECALVFPVRFDSDWLPFIVRYPANTSDSLIHKGICASRGFDSDDYYLMDLSRLATENICM